jgi:NFU1 iron-sulfur cluster scaffold homolog, mitochondrial
LNIIGREETPNPAAVKFLLDGPVIASGTLSLTTGEDEEDEYRGDNQTAIALFKLGAQEVFFFKNSVSITMFSAKAWEFFMEDVIETLESSLIPPGEEPPPEEKKKSFLDDFDKESFPGLPEIEKLSFIESLMDEIIRPALANDGGGLEVSNFESNIVEIKYQGACGTCPSSSGATHSAIQRALKNYLDPQLTVSIKRA